MSNQVQNRYNAESIQVLTGLDPVKKRPGMYTNTSNPNHLGLEVIDNSVDEALAGYANEIYITLHTDQSLSVKDNGRGMPVDIHPEMGVTGVELIMLHLHAGGKFSNKNYQFAGGLHGVGISVVNALSQWVDVTIKRHGKIHHIRFENGFKASELTVIGTCPSKETGTQVHFLPATQYFDTSRFSIKALTDILRAKALLCSGLKIYFFNEITSEEETWHYQDGLSHYISDQLHQETCLPTAPFIGKFECSTETVEWAITWTPETSATITESYVNLIPTAQGGTHVNGLRTGILEALREFCELRELLPRGLKLAPEDVWNHCNYVLSLKMQEAQFSGQTKERLTSRQAASFISGVVKDSFSIWLNEHVSIAEELAQFIIQEALKRTKSAKKVKRKQILAGPALPGKLADSASQDLQQTELFLVEGESAGGSAKQARNKEFQAVMGLRGKILNTWEMDSNEILSSQEVHDIAVAIGVDPGSQDLSGLRYGKICILTDADHDGLHIATLLCALFVKHFPTLVQAGHVYAAMPPLYRIDFGKEVFYALDDDEKQGILDRLQAEHRRGKFSVTRFKGLGEMNPLQLRETTMNPDTRRLIQLTDATPEQTQQLLDLLLAKKRSGERKIWLQAKGNLADLA